MNRILLVLLSASAISTCIYMTMRDVATEEPEVSVIAIAPEDTRPMEEAMLAIEFTNMNSFDVRLVGMAGC